VKRIGTVVMATALFASAVTFAAEPAVFIDLKDIQLADAADFIGRVTNHHIELGPGATGRITLSTPRAMTYDELLAAFDVELARNGLTAIKRGRDMLIVTVQTPSATLASAVPTAPQLASPASPTGVVGSTGSTGSPAPSPPAAVVASMPPPLPTPAARAPLSYVDSSEARARALVTRLQAGGIPARLVAPTDDAEAGFDIQIDVPADADARRQLGQKIASLDLSALFQLPR
jgi:hypothetical protein